MYFSEVQVHVINYHMKIKLWRKAKKEGCYEAKEFADEAAAHLEKALNVAAPNAADIYALLMLVRRLKPKLFKGRKPVARALRLALNRRPG